MLLQKKIGSIGDCYLGILSESDLKLKKNNTCP